MIHHLQKFTVFVINIGRRSCDGVCWPELLQAILPSSDGIELSFIQNFTGVLHDTTFRKWVGFVFGFFFQGVFHEILLGTTKPAL